MSLLIVLLNTTFFYHGCDNSFYYSIGAAAPFLEVVVENNDPWPSSIESVSPVAFVQNLVLAVAVLYGIGNYCPRLARGLASHTFLVALSLSVAAMNSFLVSSNVWAYVTWWPTLYVAEAFEWLLYGTDDSPETVGRLDVVLGARVYFILLLACLYLIIRFGAYLLTRFVLVDPKRWWQLQLGGLMAVAVFLGTAIGLLVRILRPSG